MGKSRLLFVGLLGFTILRCEGVPLTAPPGSSIFLQANPSFVEANGGRAVVSALVTEPTGMLVPDGTEVLFMVTIGRIDERVKTRDGVARANFVADSRSGTATVTAMSGGPAAATPAPSPTTSTTNGATTPAAAQASGEGTASIDITVGSARPTRVVVGANPQRITGSRQATIVANVYDNFGNPLKGVPVIFRITSVSIGTSPTTTTTTTTTSTTSSTTSTTTLAASPGLSERLGSGGSPQYTDSSGQAFDVLYTSAPAGGIQRIVEVQATTSNGVSATVSVYID